MQEWSCKITEKPNLEKLRKQKHISKLEDETTRAIENRGLEVVQQLVIPNYQTPSQKSHPLRADIYVPEKNLILEIDGCYHNDMLKQHKRDLRILAMANQTEQQLNVEHVDYLIPPNLIYGNLRGKKREEVRDLYEEFRHTWIMHTVFFVIHYPFFIDKT
jgi:very-short-patch-repair endonuclease